MTRSARRSLLLRLCVFASALAVGVACGSDRAASKVDATPASARPTLKDERYLIGLMTPPGQGWALLAEADAKRLHPAAVAGWRKGDTCVGWVAVTPKPEGVSRDAYGEAAYDALALPGKTKAYAERALYCSMTAWRWEAWGHDEADGTVWIAHRASFLEYAGHFYEVHARARGTVRPNLRRCLDAITASFDFIPGAGVDLSRPAPR